MAEITDAESEKIVKLVSERTLQIFKASKIAIASNENEERNPTDLNK